MAEEKKKKTIKDISPNKTPIPEQDAKERSRNFKEVALGYSEEQALQEAERCLDCKKPKCIDGCPVKIDIPGFIREISKKNYKKSFEILKQANTLPAVCGRVCPQEEQCEQTCIINKKMDPVGIGRLERFIADWAIKNVKEKPTRIEGKNGWTGAVIGSGPSGLACAADLQKAGIQTTIFEALHVPGGVLKYGIPEFRLPNDIIDVEIMALQNLGVEIRTNAIIGKLFTIPYLMEEMGYDVVFIGSGAGFPKFMGIEGENLNGVFSANEYLTRVNLMGGYMHPKFDTPVGMGKKVCVIGAGNTAMDACRVSLRMGAEQVVLVYRRSEAESPARIEELHHAKEEGVITKWLTNPIRILGDDKGWVTGMECIEMELGEPDDSGRRRPIPKEGTNFIVDCDTVVSALGTEANPIIAQTTPGLDINKWGYIEADPDTMLTSLPGVAAGGDIVTGAATVILAMGAGRTAAASLINYLKERDNV